MHHLRDKWMKYENPPKKTHVTYLRNWKFDFIFSYTGKWFYGWIKDLVPVLFVKWTQLKLMSEWLSLYQKTLIEICQNLSIVITYSTVNEIVQCIYNSRDSLNFLSCMIFISKIGREVQVRAIQLLKLI